MKILKRKCIFFQIKGYSSFFSKMEHNLPRFLALQLHRQRIIPRLFDSKIRLAHKIIPSKYLSIINRHSHLANIPFEAKKAHLILPPKLRTLFLSNCRFVLLVPVLVVHVRVHLADSFLAYLEIGLN